MENTPENCPKCQKNDQVVKICYGMLNEEGMEQVRQGLIYSGGCCPTNNKWRCKSCEFSFPRKN